MTPTKAELNAAWAAACKAWERAHKAGWTAATKAKHQVALAEYNRLQDEAKSKTAY